MGRPRKPTESLERGGGYREDRHGDRKNQPQFEGEPEQPADLSDDAKAHWEAVVPDLVAGGVAKAIDTSALAAMCESWAEYSKAKRLAVYDLQEMRQRQMLMSGALKLWRDLAARFGLTPADRAKLEVVPDGEEENPILALMQPEGSSKEGPPKAGAKNAKGTRRPVHRGRA